jgi:hypothetical protein
MSLAGTSRKPLVKSLSAFLFIGVGVDQLLRGMRMLIEVQRDEERAWQQRQADQHNPKLVVGILDSEAMAAWAAEKPAEPDPDESA